MSHDIRYAVRENKLTVPPSFKCEFQSKASLDFDLIAIQINLHNPTIPVPTAKACLLAFKEEVKIQIQEGNTINLEGFVSFVPSFPVNLAVATDPLPTNPMSILAKVSTPFRDYCRVGAVYSRTGYPVKAPGISSVTGGIL